jgi:MAF protein
MNQQVILASQSLYKQNILNRLPISFESVTPDVDETPYISETAKALTLRLAKAKALAVADTYPKNFIISTDQAATVEGLILGKPHTFDAACRMLETISEQSIYFFTSVCLVTPRNEVHLHTEKVIVNMRSLAPAEIKRYVTLDSPLDCAGSFKVESLGISLFTSVQSQDPTALEGLPLIKLCQWLRDQGFKIP